MKIIRPATYSEVTHYLAESHPISDTENFRSNEWAHLITEKANEVLGRWLAVELEEDEFQNIILPHHIGEGTNTELVPPEGLTVRQTTEKLRALLSYPDACPECWKKITYWKENGPLPLLLSTTPVGSERHELLSDSVGQLFHLDGLHRLLALGLAGKPKKLKAFLVTK